MSKLEQTENSEKPVFRSRLIKLWALLALMGPGIITSNVDNDAGGITTYSLAGAKYGLSMLWSLVPITLILVIVQEMGARMGVVSGKGLSDLIRERFGVKITFYVMILLVITNLGNTIAEFAGIAASLEIFGISKYLAIPLGIMFLMWLAVKGTYRSVEKVFLIACIFYVSYVAVGFIVKPDWIEVVGAMGRPTIRLDTDFLLMLTGLVGTTIAPWMQFYLQASVVDKGLRVQDLKAVRIDVIVGSIAVSIVAFFIILACAATLFKAGVNIEEASQAALSGTVSREILHMAFCLRVVQRVGIRCRDPAAINGIHDMRSIWMGIKPGQEILGSATILRPLLLHNILLRFCDPRPELTFDFNNVRVPDIEWPGLANHSSFHPAPDK